MLAPSTRLGPYEILAPLGAGGMGEVYRARDTRLEREVAVKVLPAAFAHDPDRRARFEREAKAVAALSHPNILAIHDCGTDHGVAFAVMELLEGETLRRRLARGPLPWRKAAEVAAAVADGLAAAHAKGVVHRDLKPENLFLTTDGRVKVLDFGLARFDPPPPPQPDTAPYFAAQTDPGTVLGTAAYMAPEQVRGRPVDGRGDLFALGCVLYEMVTGQMAFTRPTKAETMTAVLHDEPPEPSDSGKKVPPALEAVIRHCLEKSPEERFESARDLAFALRALLTDSGAAAAQPGLGVYLRPLAAAVAVLVVAGGLLAALLALRGGPRTGAGPGPAVESIAVLPLANDSGDPGNDFLSDGVTECLINHLAQLPGLRVLARSTVFRYKGRDVSPQEVGRELNVRAVLTGHVAQRGDSLNIQVELVDADTGAQLWGERYVRRFADIFPVQEEIARHIASRLRLRLTGAEQERLARRPTANAEAFKLYLLGRFHWNKRTKDGLQRGADYFRRAIEADPTYAQAYARLADSYLVLTSFNYLPAREAVPRARGAAARALELDPTLGEAYTSRGWVKYVYDWDWAGAEADFQAALALNPGYATGHHWYADYLTALGRFDDAGAEMRRAQELDPLSDIINRDVAWPLYFARRYDDAIAQLRKALDAHPDFSPAYSLLGRAYEQKGDHGQALAALQKAVELTHGENASTRSMLAHAYASAGKPDEARRILAELEKRALTAHVSPYALATVHAALDDHDRAIALLRRSADEKGSDLVYLKVDPKLDRLRGDPRFQELLKTMNLPP